MYPEAPTSLGNCHQRPEKLGQFGGQGGELIDHHDEAGDSRTIAHGSVGGEVARCGIAQEVLAAA